MTFLLSSVLSLPNTTEIFITTSINMLNLCDITNDGIVTLYSLFY